MVSLQIWSNRLLRECQDISNEGTLVVQGGTATLEDHRLDPQHGNCKLQMHFVLPSWSGKLEFDCGIKTRYPFDPPVVKIIEGAEGLPTHLKSNSVFLLPLGMGWTPSNTLRTCMLSIAAAVADSSSSNSPERAAPESNSSSRIARVYEVGETIRMDGVAGSVFPCRIRVPVSGLDETAAPSSYLVHRFLAVTPSQLVELDAAAEANHLHVLRVMPLRALSKLRFARGESVTVLPHGEDEPRTYFMTRSYQCVQVIQDQLNAMKIAAHHTNANLEYHIDKAREVQLRAERSMHDVLAHPEMDGVKEAMDLARQAVEMYGAVDDDRSQQVMQRLHTFLREPRVIDVLEGRGFKDEAEDGAPAGPEAEPPGFPTAADMPPDAPPQDVRSGEAEDLQGGVAGVTPGQVQNDLSDDEPEVEVLVSLSTTPLSQEDQGDRIDEEGPANVDMAPTSSIAEKPRSGLKEEEEGGGGEAPMDEAGSGSESAATATASSVKEVEQDVEEKVELEEGSSSSVTSTPKSSQNAKKRARKKKLKAAQKG